MEVVAIPLNERAPEEDGEADEEHDDDRGRVACEPREDDPEEEQAEDRCRSPTGAPNPCIALPWADQT